MEAETSGVAERADRIAVIAAEKNRLAAKILDGETERVKFNRDRIIASKTTNRNQIFNQRWRKKNVAKIERGGRRSGDGGVPVYAAGKSALAMITSRGVERASELPTM